MCGIFGVVGTEKIDRDVFHASTALLAHRGPDSLEIAYLNEDQLGFGFTRLSIQDTSAAANQPMSDEENKTLTIYNGEAYNFQILREEFVNAGDKFRTGSDTEVVIKCYRRFGWEKTLERLEGMFGLAIFDRPKNILHLARDRFGMKPVFYTEYRGGIVFASEIKAILNYTGKGKINFHSSLNPILTTGLCPDGETMFEDVRELDAGSFIIFNPRNKTLKVERYFHLSDWVCKDTYREMSTLPEKPFIKRFQQSFTDSISQHLLSDVPLGILFSAGLDSSLVAAVAGTLSNSQLNLLKYSSEALADDSLARSFAKKFNAELHLVQNQDDQLIYDLPRMIYHYETINKEEGVALARVCRTARLKKFKVLLTGDASDEVFGGYAQHKAYYASAVLRNNRLSKKIIGALNHLIPGFGNLNDNPLGSNYVMSPPGLNLLEIPLNILFHKGKRLEDWHRNLDAYSFEKNKAQRDTGAYLLDEVENRLKRFMIRADRFGMMESMELRLPYLHPSLVRLALNTPVRRRIGFSLKNLGGFSLISEKRVVKRLAGKCGVPQKIIRRKKIGTPFKGRQDVQEILQKWELRNLGELFDISPRDLRFILSDSIGEAGRMRLEWSFLASEILLRIFQEHIPHEEITEEFRSILGARSVEPSLA